MQAKKLWKHKRSRLQRSFGKSHSFAAVTQVSITDRLYFRSVLTIFADSILEDVRSSNCGNIKKNCSDIKVENVLNTP